MGGIRRIVTVAFLLVTLAGCTNDNPGGGGTTYAVWGWGANEFGQLGDGTRVDRPVPARLSLDRVVEVKAGLFHTIALRDDGALVWWGSNRIGIAGDTRCPAGNDFYWCELTTVVLPQVVPLRAIDAGDDFGLGIKRDGSNEVCRWGENAGQHGSPTIGTPSPRDGPWGTVNCALTAPDRILSVAAGGRHALALGATQGEFCGFPAGWCRSAPSDVPGLTDVMAIAAGSAHSLALRTDRSVWAWGSQDQSQLGIPAPAMTSGRPSPVNEVSFIAAGSRHSLVVRDGEVWTWGDDTYHQASARDQGQLTVQFGAIRIPPLTDVVEVAGGDDFSIALKSDGTVWAWGANGRGQPGAQSADSCGPRRTPCSIMPIRVENIANARHVTAGGQHALALVER